MRAIVTGATGMVGEGVVQECLARPEVERVLVIGRRACGVVHPKLSERLLADVSDLSSIADGLAGYDACFFCLGATSLGKSEEEYARLTHDLTLRFAATLAERSPGLVFLYVSGSGTDGTERGRVMWARVKGRTENDLRKLPFKAVYGVRPGYIQPTPGNKNTLKAYAYISWLYPVLKALSPKRVCTLRQLSRAMVNAALEVPAMPVLEVPDILGLASPPA